METRLDGCNKWSLTQPHPLFGGRCGHPSFASSSCTIGDRLPHRPVVLQVGGPNLPFPPPTNYHGELMHLIKGLFPTGIRFWVVKLLFLMRLWFLWKIRVGLDHGEEVHWSRSLGEWSNMVGYEMGSSRVGVYQWRTSSVNGKNDMVGQHSNTFCKGSSPEVKFLGQPQTLGQETWPLENSNLRLFFYCFSHLVCHGNRCLK